MIWENLCKHFFCKRCGVIDECYGLFKENNEFIKINKHNINKCNELFNKNKKQQITIRQLNENINNKDTKIIELNQKINKLEGDDSENWENYKGVLIRNDYLEDILSNYEEILGQKHSDWHIERNKAWRYNKDNSKIEKYEIPIKFDIEKVKIIDFDDNLKMITYTHDDDFGGFKEYKNPISLYKTLGGKLFNNKKENKKMDHNNKDLINDEIKKILISKRWNLRGKYIEKIIDFMREYWLKRFVTKDINDYCEFKNRETRRQYIKKLINSGLVRKVKNGVYEFIPIET